MKLCANLLSGGFCSPIFDALKPEAVTSGHATAKNAKKRSTATAAEAVLTRTHSDSLQSMTLQRLQTAFNAASLPAAIVRAVSAVPRPQSLCAPCSNRGNKPGGRHGAQKVRS